MYTPKTPEGSPEEIQKRKTGETASETSRLPQEDEASRSITPVDPDRMPQDTVRDAKERWETESPAIKGQPQQHADAKEYEHPDEDLLKKRDETGVS